MSLPLLDVLNVSRVKAFIDEEVLAASSFSALPQIRECLWGFSLISQDSRSFKHSKDYGRSLVEFSHELRPILVKVSEKLCLILQKPFRSHIQALASLLEIHGNVIKALYGPK